MKYDSYKLVHFAGSFRIYEVEENDTKPLLYADVPTSKPLRVIIRTYCLQGIQLACNSPIKDRFQTRYYNSLLFTV